MYDESTKYILNKLTHPYLSIKKKRKEVDKSNSLETANVGTKSSKQNKYK